jgi:hypothetical protein
MRSATFRSSHDQQFSSIPATMSQGAIDWDWSLRSRWAVYRLLDIIWVFGFMSGFGYFGDCVLGDGVIFGSELMVIRGFGSFGTFGSGVDGAEAKNPQPSHRLGMRCPRSLVCMSLSGFFVGD